MHFNHILCTLMSYKYDSVAGQPMTLLQRMNWIELIHIEKYINSTVRPKVCVFHCDAVSVLGILSDTGLDNYFVTSARFHWRFCAIVAFEIIMATKGKNFKGLYLKIHQICQIGTWGNRLNCNRNQQREKTTIMEVTWNKGNKNVYMS